MKSPAGRRAFTLIETMIAIVIGLLIMAGIWKLFLSSILRTGEANEELELVIGVRNLMENLTRDVNAAFTVVPQSGGTNPTSQIVLVRSDRPRVRQRLEANRDQETYPFSMVSGAEHKLPGVRVTYAYDATKKTVSRSESAGTLVQKFGSSKEVRELVFQESGTASTPRVLATQIRTFNLHLVGYDSEQQLQPLEPDKAHRTACVGVEILADGDDPPPAAGAPRRRRAIKMEMLTKIWLMTRLHEAVYPEYFSSIDEDLRY